MLKDSSWPGSRSSSLRLEKALAIILLFLILLGWSSLCPVSLGTRRGHGVAPLGRGHVERGTNNPGHGIWGLGDPPHLDGVHQGLGMERDGRALHPLLLSHHLLRPHNSSTRWTRARGQPLTFQDTKRGAG